MATATYKQQLTDPRWQRRRLEILQRDGFKCQECGDSISELHVHHGYYASGMKPWDYPAETLHTLCHECHGVAEGLLAEIRPLMGRLGFGDLTRLLDWLKSMEEVPAPPVAAHAEEFKPAADDEAAWLQSIVDGRRQLIHKTLRLVGSNVPTVADLHRGRRTLR